MIFETDRLRVRALTEKDTDCYFSLYGDEEVMKYIRPAKSKSECEELLLSHIEINRQIFPFGRWLAETKTDREVVGSFVIIPVEGTSLWQLGYSLLKHHWKKGFASELTEAGLRYAFTQTPLEEIFAIAEDANIASLKILMKAGFIKESGWVQDDKTLTRFIFRKKNWLTLL